MPELPEINNLARQMNKELNGKTIARVKIIQEKCLNMPGKEFREIITGKQIGTIKSKGKWIFVSFGEDMTLLLNLGMGGDVLYHKQAENSSSKYKLLFQFTDKSSLSINFWWFGYVHAIYDKNMSTHKMTSELGISPLDPEFTLGAFKELIKNKRNTVKSLILDQKTIAGIGNVYSQDILFQARIHPNNKISRLKDSEIESLYKAIVDNLHAAVAQRGLKFEKDLYGNGGSIENFLVGYREGQLCPVCETIIEKIKTGSTASYICPKCQIK